MPPSLASRTRKPVPACRLQTPGWSPRTRAALEALIEKGARKALPVVFDFDNTIVRGDIGEATLAVLVRSGVITPTTLPPGIHPSFKVPGRGPVTSETCADPTEYYGALLDPTAHGPRDPTPLATGYAWAVEVMAGLRVSDVVHAARCAFQWSDPAKPGFIEVTPGKTAYPVPVFYPEMVELLAELLRHEFDVWIFSASNVWSVRWMVIHALNPLLRRHGLTRGLRPDRVVGVSTLLADRKGCWYKDTVLVREDKSYASLDQGRLGELRLTSRLHFPVPTYSGKIAAIFDALGGGPYLAAGDSPGDHPMMAVSEHRLWIARLEKPAYQRAALKMARTVGGTPWLVQPTLTGSAPGFVPDLRRIPRSGELGKAPIRESLRVLRGFLR